MKKWNQIKLDMNSAYYFTYFLLSYGPSVSRVLFSVISPFLTNISRDLFATYYPSYFLFFVIE